MPSGRVVDRNEIYLNGTLFPISRPVQPTLASVYPGKIVIGDTSKDSDPHRSLVAWSDFRGGIGRNVLEGSADVDRAWWSTMRLAFKGHVVLPPRAVQTAAPSGPTSPFTTPVLVEFGNEMYATFGTAVHLYDNVADDWGSSLHTLPAAATDALVVRIQGTVYLVIATGTGFSYSSDGTTWADATDDVKYLAWWDNKLWGIDSTGQLRVTVNLTSWGNDAQLPLPDDYVTGLFTDRDAAGNEILYCTTKIGLWAHDVDNNVWVRTELETPFHPDFGLGTAKWRGSLFMPAGLQVYRRNNGPTAVVTVMGPDRDDGLPQDKRGTIVKLVPTHNDLLAILDATTAPTTYDNYMYHQSFVIGPETGFSAILAWNELGWECRWLGGESSKAIEAAVTTNAYSVYRLWWVHNERVYYMSLPREVINPNEVPSSEYAASGELITPWFTGGQANVTKLALALKVECDRMSANETFTISYATDYSDTYTQFGTISSDGVTTYEFPDSTDPTGTQFLAIRFKVEGVRGSTVTNTPDLISLSLEWTKKLDPRWGFAIEVKLTEDYKGKTVHELRSALLTMTEQALLGEFTYRNDSGNTRNFFVRVQSATGLEASGEDERGTSSLLLVEI